MRALSPLDGSADAVRDAADAAVDGNRMGLERELDRLNLAIHGAASAMGQHLNSLLVSQSMLLLAYLVVLIAAWSVPIPGKRWLLAGVATLGLFSVVMPYLGLRAARDRLGPLKDQRKRVEEALERVAARPPVFARQGAVTAMLAQLATRGLPLAMCAGWVLLMIYTLALTMPTDARSVVSVPVAPSSLEARSAPPSRPKASAPAKNATATATAESPAAAATEPTAESNDSPILNFFRRATSAPPAVEPTERVTP